MSPETSNDGGLWIDCRYLKLGIGSASSIPLIRLHPFNDFSQTEWYQDRVLVIIG